MTTCRVEMIGGRLTVTPVAAPLALVRGPYVGDPRDARAYVPDTPWPAYLATR